MKRIADVLRNPKLTDFGGGRLLVDVWNVPPWRPECPRHSAGVLLLRVLPCTLEKMVIRRAVTVRVEANFRRARQRIWFGTPRRCDWRWEPLSSPGGTKCHHLNW